jgi:hypothetical protein
MQKGLRYNGIGKWRLRASVDEKWARIVREDNDYEKM